MANNPRIILLGHPHLDVLVIRMRRKNSVYFRFPFHIAVVPVRHRKKLNQYMIIWFWANLFHLLRVCYLCHMWEDNTSPLHARYWRSQWCTLQNPPICANLCQETNDPGYNKASCFFVHFGGTKRLKYLHSNSVIWRGYKSLHNSYNTNAQFSFFFFFVNVWAIR